MSDALLNNKMDFAAFKNLSAEERDYFIFDTLSRIDERTAGIQSRYASKWVETVMKSAAAVTLMGIFAAILAQVGIKLHSGA